MFKTHAGLLLESKAKFSSFCRSKEVQANWLTDARHQDIMNDA